MAGSDETPVTDQSSANTQPRPASLLYRRPLGLAWLISLAVIPLLLGGIGFALHERSQSGATGPTGPLPTLSQTTPPNAPPTPAGVPAISFAPASVVRNGNDVTLTGDFPDETAKKALEDAVKNGMGAGVNVIDRLGINPNIDALDFSKATTVFIAAAQIPDFRLSVNGDTITLAGTAATGDQADAVEQAAQEAWQNLNILDQVVITGPVTATGSPGPAPPAAPGGPIVDCAHLQQEIHAVLPSPITFDNNGFTLTPDAQQELALVADKLKACPGANVSINGYSDDTGDGATNIALSDSRANSVADFLIGKGVTRDHLTSKGFGSADPVAGNDTPEGRAKNRRVEIIVI